MEDHTKEVRFDIYCKKCEFKDKVETDDPCNDCLNEPANINSHRPVYFKEKEGLTNE